MNEKHFIVNIGIFVIAILTYLIGFGDVDKNSIIGILGSIGFNVSLLLSLGFGLQYFQLGTKRDIQKEIYNERNVAVAIYQAGIWMSLAIAIGKGLF